MTGKSCSTFYARMQWLNCPKCTSDTVELPRRRSKYRSVHFKIAPKLLPCFSLGALNNILHHNYEPVVQGAVEYPRANAEACHFLDERRPVSRLHEHASGVRHDLHDPHAVLRVLHLLVEMVAAREVRRPNTGRPRGQGHRDDLALAHGACGDSA